MTTNRSTAATDVGWSGIRFIQQLVLFNLALVALQPLSAGFLMSGYARALTLHAAVAVALQVGALVQAATALVLWRLGRAPAWVAGASVGLFAIVFLQVGFGYQKSYWLHVPIGVGIFGWLTRQANWLDASEKRSERHHQHHGEHDVREKKIRTHADEREFPQR